MSLPTNTNSQPSETLIPTPLKVAGSSLQQFHRIQFNTEIFGCSFTIQDDTAPKMKKNSTSFSRTRYNKYVEMVKDYKSVGPHLDGETKEISKARGQYKAKYGSLFYTMNKYDTVDSVLPDGSTKVLLKKKPNKAGAPALDIAVDEDVFDAIATAHEAVGHKKMAQTFNEIKKRYINITKEQCSIFCDLCPVCNKKVPKMKKLKGASNPIQSLSFRDRFQCDLIDYQSNPQKDWNGVVMKWCLVLKDHFTKLIYLKAVPRKEARLVAAELDLIIGLLGPPLVYHSDNGGEVAGNAIVNILKEMNKNITTVTGRPRTPSDQGSVERGNQTVKDVLSSLEEQERQRGNSQPNWVLLLGKTMAAVNGGRNFGQNSTSPYEHVFGMEMYQFVGGHKIEELQMARTVSEMDAMIANPIFHQKMMDLGELGSPGTVKPSQSEDDEPEAKPIAKQLFSEEEPNKSVIAVKTENLRTPPRHRLSKEYYPITMKEALSRGKNRYIQDCHYQANFKFVFPKFECSTCCSRAALIPVGDDKLWDHLKTTTCWWLEEVTVLFGILLCHSHHKEGVLFLNSGFINKKSNETAKGIALDEAVKYVLTIGRLDGHYALLEFDIEKQTVGIYDGYESFNWEGKWTAVLERIGHDPMGWKVEHKAKHIQDDSQSCGPLACACLWNLLEPGAVEISEVVRHLPDGLRIRKIIVEELIRMLTVFEKDIFKVKREVIEILDDNKRDKRTKEWKDNNKSTKVCGICLCDILEDQLSRITCTTCCENTFHSDCIGGTEAGCPCCYRKPLDEQTKAPPPSPPPSTIPPVASATISKEVTVTPRSKVAVDTLAGMRSSTSNSEMASLEARKIHKLESDRKRRKAQEVQAAGMKRHREENTNVKVGDVVTLKVDVRDKAQHNASFGVMGIVLRVASRSGASIIGTKGGVICNKQSSKPFYVKYDNFKVLQKYTISRELRTMQKRILEDSTFLPEDRCSIRKAHEAEYGKTTHTGRSRCSCNQKHGCLASRCGCLRSGQPCSSRCACHGQCGNRVDHVDPDTLETPLK